MWAGDGMNWACGAEQYHTAEIWVGGDDPKEDLTRVRLIRLQKGGWIGVRTDWIMGDGIVGINLLIYGEEYC